MARKVFAVDLFCGAGGTSTGLARACKDLGIDVDLLAINHWETAVNSHAQNHPWARHLCVPVESVNPREAMPGGRVDILCASPECTHHSTARGGKPVNDQLRASAWHIMRWVNELDVRNILIENVPEFESWGPTSKRTKRPIKAQRGQYFRAFIQALESSGYTVQWRILNAADYGDATSRRRLFIMARKGKGEPVWPTPTHSKGGLIPGTQRWRAAREIIDWSLEGRSIFERERPLSRKTIDRILVGLERHGGPELKPFLVVMRGTSTAQSVEQPVQALTAGGQHVGVAEPFILSMASQGAPRPVSEPAPTFVAGGGGSLVQPVLLPPDGPGGNGEHNHAKPIAEPVPTIRASRGDRIGLIEPVLVDTFGSKDTWPARGQSVDVPLPTVAGNGRWGMAEPVLVPYNGNSTPTPVSGPLPTQPTHDRFGLVQPFIITTDRLDTNRSVPRPVSEPVPTVVAAGTRIGLVEASFLVPNFGERDGQTPRTHSIHAPLPTPTSHGAGALVQPHILHVTHGGRERSVDDPLPTLTGANRGELALVQPVVNGRKLDIRFRMLQPHELARAMGFDDSYAFVGTKAAVVKQIGNAVAVNMAHALIAAALQRRYGRA